MHTSSFLSFVKAKCCRKRFPVATGWMLAPLSLVLTGCQAVVSPPTASQVRIITVSPDAPSLDLYLNNKVLAYQLGFGTITSYIAVDAGAATVSANMEGTRQVLVSAKSTFVSPNQYTVLVGNVTANMQGLVLKDQAQAAPAGQIALRVIDQATQVGALDLYLVPVGRKITAVAPLLAGLTFGNMPTYLNVQTGTYTLMAVPAGTVLTATTVPTYTGSQLSYSGGSATTVVLLDEPRGAKPGVQVITANDYTSPTAAN